MRKNKVEAKNKTKKKNLAYSKLMGNILLVATDRAPVLGGLQTVVVLAVRALEAGGSKEIKQIALLAERQGL